MLHSGVRGLRWVELENGVRRRCYDRWLLAVVKGLDAHSAMLGSKREPWIYTSRCVTLLFPFRRFHPEDQRPSAYSRPCDAM
ncbi:unnamed protein product [Ectocarpus sp. 12 AP-2014]